MKKISTLLLLIILSTPAIYAQNWNQLVNGLGGATDTIRAIAVDPSGNIYAGDTFTTPFNHIAKWSVQSQNWEAVGSGVNGTVYAIGIKTNSDIYVGGSFTAAGNVTVNNIARYNGTGTWTDLDGGFDRQVNCIYTPASGKVYAGGQFTHSGANTVNHISEYVGGHWVQLGTGINAEVNAITIHNSILYAGSSIATPVLKFDAGTWTTVAGITGGKVNALASFDGYLYAGGEFSQPSAAAAKYDGTNWGTINTTFTSQDKIYALFARTGTTNALYIGGKYTDLGIVNRKSSNISRIASYLTPIQSVTDTSSKINGTVYAIGNQSGKVIAGGNFTSPATNIAITSTTVNVDELSDLVVEKNFYPNPVHGKANLVISTIRNINNPELRIYDLQSRLVTNATIETIVINNQIEFIINCENLPPGNYSYLISEDGKGIVSDKFIVE